MKNAAARAFRSLPPHFYVDLQLMELEEWDHLF